MRQVAIRIILSLVGCSLVGSSTLNAQGRPIDWPSYNNDAQRTGWEKVDSRITKDNVKDFRLVLKRKLDNGPGGPNSLTPPVIIGLLISYRGFKELGFVAGSSGNLWAIDVDVDRIFWQKHIDNDAKAKGACAGGVKATPALIPPINFALRPRPAGVPGAPGTVPITPTPTPPPTTATGATPPRPAGRTMMGPGGFGAPRPAFVVSNDGKLHLLNTSTGDDVSPPMNFLPANVVPSSLTVVENTVYTTATDCDNGRSGVWALDLGGPEKKSAPVASFALKGGSVSRQGGLAMATDGTVFVQTGPGTLDASASKWSNTLLALSPKKLKLTNYFTEPDAGSGASITTPVVFNYKDKELVVSAGADGRLYLLDAKNPGGDDHKTPLYQTAAVTSAGASIWGGLSSWQEPNGTRWILAPVWGDLNPELKFPGHHDPAPNGSIVAFKLQEHGGKLELTPAWGSRDLHSPEQPVITSGVVFALSAGDYGKDGHSKSSMPAVLYALDGTTGKEMYSTGDQVTAPGNLTGVTLANGRVFFSTTDSTLYAFGIYMER